MPKGSSSGSDIELINVSAMSAGEHINEDYLPSKKQLLDHKHPVNALAFSSDGRTVASGSTDKLARVWDLASGKCLLSLAAHSDAVLCVALSPDGTMLVTGSKDALAIAWDTRTGERKATFKGSGSAILDAAISPTLGTVYTGTKSGHVTVWQVSTGTLEASLDGHSDAVLGVAVSPNGALVVTGSEDKSIRIWDTAENTCIRVMEGHSGSVNAVAISPDNQYVVSGSKDETIKVWSLATGDCLRTLKGHVDDIYDIDLTADSLFIVSASNDSTVRVWSFHTGQCLQVLRGHQDPVLSVAVSPSGRHIVSAGGSKLHRKGKLVCVGEDGVLFRGSVWLSLLHSLLLSLSLCACVLACCPLFNPLPLSCSFFLFVVPLCLPCRHDAAADTSIRTWSLWPGARQRVLSGHGASVKAVAVSQQSDLVASASNDYTAKLWDLSTGECRFTLSGHSDYVRGVALSSDDSFVVTGSCDNTARVWDTATGTCTKVLEGHSFTVAALAVAADNSAIATGSWGGSIKLWSWPGGSCTNTLKGHTGKILSLSFAPPTGFAGKYANAVVSASEDCLVKVWDAAAAQCMLTLEGHTDAVNAAMITMDGAFVVSCSDDGDIVMWDLDADGAPTRRLLGHNGRVYSLDLSQDGRFLLSGSWDKTAKLWDLSSGEVLRTLGEHNDRVRCVVLKNSDTMVLAVGSKVRTASLNLDFDFPTLAYNRDANPDAFLANLDQPADAYSISFLQPLLCTGARVGRVENVRSLAERNPPVALNFCQLLSAALDSHSEECVRVVVELMVAAIKNTLQGEQGLFWSPQVNYGIHIEMARLVQRFPSLLDMLMTNCPLIPSSAAATSNFSVSDFVGAEEDNAGYMEFCPCDYLDFPAWAFKQGRASTTHVEMRPVQTPPPSATLRRQAKAVRARRMTADGAGRLLDPDDRDRAPMSTVETLVLPFAQLAGSEASGVDFLKELLQTGRADSFAGIIPQVLVEYRWRCFGRRLHMRNMALYVLTLALFVTMGFLGQHLEGSKVTDLGEGRMDGEKPAALVVGTMLLLVTLYHTVRELRQAWTEGPGMYFQSVWNWLDAVRIIFSFVAVITLFLDYHSASRFFFAIGSYLFWFGILFYMQAFSTTGPLVRMVLEIVVGMRWFLLVLGIALLATANVFTLLLDDSPAPPQGYQDVADVLLTMFRLLMLADLELLNFDAGRYTIPLKLVWVLTMILVPIVLLNLLIALMSDSYELIQDKAVVEFQRLRAQIIREQEIYFDRSVFLRQDWYPQYLHVLLPRGRNTGGAESAQWQGMLHALRNEVNARADETVSRVENVENKVDRLIDQLQDANEKMNQRLNNMHLLLQHSTGRKLRTRGPARPKQHE